MSKLAKAIDAVLTGNVRASRNLGLRYTEVKFAVNESGRLLTKEALLRVTLEKRFFKDDTLDADMVYHDIKRSMIEEVFGEFRPLLIEMRGALYDEDTNRVRTLLAEFEQQMFRDGL